MAEIRCPMCGKLNQEELNVCQFCEARLKPLWVDPSQGEESSELPYWLNSDREDEPDVGDVPPTEDTEEPRDWLDQIRSESKIEDELSQEMESEPLLDDDESLEAEEDWIQRFRSLQDVDQTAETDAFETQPDDEFPSEGPIQPSPEDETLEQEELDRPDWLDRLQGDTDDEDTSEQDQDTIPDWFSGEPSEKPEVEPEAEPDLAGEEETPDWLSGLGVEDEAGVPEEAEPTLEGEILDWISGPPSEEPESEFIGEEETPDWLSGLGIEEEAGVPEEAEPALEGEIPDWFSGPPSEEPETEPEFEMEDTETPDWLSELGIEGEAGIPEEAKPALEGEIPDWVSEPPAEEPEPEFVGEEETPDWLSELGIEEEAGVSEEAEPSLEGELPDWISEPPAEEPEFIGDEETPDWLSELGIEEEAGVPLEAEPTLEGELQDRIPEPPAEEPEPEFIGEEETPDWLSELGIEEEADVSEEAEPSLEGELPDWISEPSAEEPEPEFAGEEEMPDWFSELGIEEEADVSEEAEPALEGELPEWIPEPPAEEPEPEFIGDEETPEWLSELDIEDEAGVSEEAEPSLEGELPDLVPEPPAEEPGPEFLTEEETPEWLTELSIEYDKAAEEEAEPIVEGELPDWISGITSEETEVEPEPVGQEQEVPDWLSDLDQKDRYPVSADEIESEWSLEPSDDELEAAQESPRPGDQLPDWLSDSRELIPDSTEISDLLSAADQDMESISEEDRDLQGWLSELEQDTGLPGEPAPVSALSDSGEDMPSWLKNLGSVVTGSVEEEDYPAVEDGGISPFLDQEKLEEDLLEAESLPKWLSMEAEPAEDQEPVDESEIAPAELPGWLAAMRPVDVKRPQKPIDEGRVESAGPLAGLRSVLPAEPEISQFKKPPVYSAKLQVTGGQQAHAELFHKMLSTETDVEPVPPSPLISSQHALRWLIAFILIFAIGIFVIGGGEFIPLPGSAAIPDATYAASKIISAVPDQAPVLLAFDYEPGVAGEMNAAAASLVDHLMLKGTRLTVVSTLPTGPAMAEYFIQTVQSQHDYTAGLQYINLGYIPGGATGLLSFVQTPEWVFPLSYDGMLPWDTAPLRDIERLSDFALIVVITEDPDDARAWIEQVQPRVGGTPMLTVVSAQAEPLVRPYFGSGQNTQVSGIVSGLIGGAAYELAVGRTNLGRIYWDAFSVGLIIVLGAILIGGLVNVIQLLLQRDKKNTVGEQS